MRKLTRKGWVRKLDKLWAEAIKVQAGNKCQCCGVQGSFYNSHHWHTGRGEYATRWSLNNGLCLCVSCHFEAENNSGRFMDRLEAKVTLRLDRLRTGVLYDKLHAPQKYYEADFERLEEYLKKVIKSYQKE